MSKFVIAFGPNQSYYFSNGRQTLWNNVPEELGLLLQRDARFRPEKILWVSLGPNSAYFIRSTEAFGYDNISDSAQSKVDDLGGWSSVQWIIFTADPKAYLITTTDGEAFGHGLSQAFYDALLRYAFYGFKDICLGCNGGFALSTNNDKLWYAGMPPDFVPAWKSGQVLQVTTSTFDQYYFIEFKDGRSAYMCPKGWHTALQALQSTAPRTSSGSTFSNTTSYNPGPIQNMTYQSQQQVASDSGVTGFISDTASDIAVQLLQGWMQNFLGN